MKCEKCGYDGPKATYRYLYNVSPASHMAFRECPKCYHVEYRDELAEEKAERAAAAAKK
jgi:hypothetical protein